VSSKRLGRLIPVSYDADGDMLCPLCDTSVSNSENSHVECMEVLINMLTKEEVEQLKVTVEDEEYKRRGVRDS